MKSSSFRRCSSFPFLKWLHEMVFSVVNVVCLRECCVIRLTGGIHFLLRPWIMARSTSNQKSPGKRAVDHRNQQFEAQPTINEKGCRCGGDITEVCSRNVVTWGNVIQKQLVACKEIWIVLHDYLEGKEMSKCKSIRKPGELEWNAHIYMVVCSDLFAVFGDSFMAWNLKRKQVSGVCEAMGGRLKLESGYFIFILFILMSMKYIERKLAVSLQGVTVFRPLRRREIDYLKRERQQQRLHVSKLKSNNTSKSSSGNLAAHGHEICEELEVKDGLWKLTEAEKQGGVAKKSPPPISYGQFTSIYYVAIVWYTVVVL